MNIQRFRRVSVTEKILLIFFFAAFIPIVGLTLFSSSYISKTIEKEVHSNLLKHAKSYGLFTFEKIKTLETQLKLISENATSSDTLKSSLFKDINLRKAENADISSFTRKSKPKLKYFINKDEGVTFTLEKLKETTAGEFNLLRGHFSLESLFSSDANNPFNEPLCIITESGLVIFCSEDVHIKEAALKNTANILNSRTRIFEYQAEDQIYELAAWELFLPSHFQAETWYFAIIKPQSLILGTIKKFNQFFIPISLVLMLIIGYILYLSTNKLTAPLKKLTQAAKDITHGDFTPVNIRLKSNDELKELSESFNQMSSSLAYQHDKDEIFSQLERQILSNADIHSAIKETIHSFTKLIGARWMIICFKDAGNSSGKHSHLLIRNKSDQGSYAYLKHELWNTETYDSSLFKISYAELLSHYPELPVSFDSENLWVKTLSLNDKLIGSMIFAAEQNDSASSPNSAILIEFEERFSTIYLTETQRQELIHKAHYDSLTKLSNRLHLLEKLRESWSRALKQHMHLGIIYIDLDNFKNVNDLSGHKAGNQVLIEVANRIASCISHEDILARLSGDEFCILRKSIIDENELIEIAENILTQIKQPFVIKDMSFFLGASIGIAKGPDNCASPESMLERADLAMYKAKQDGKNQYQLFSGLIESERNYRLSLEHHLHFALAQNEISINYQPKIDLQTDKVTSVECLARWNQSELGFVPTDKFIALAEESGMIVEIGAWILRKSCYQFVDWANKGISLDSIAVNVSARQLASRNFTHIVKGVLEETQIPAHCLDLEITESAFINDESLLNEELAKLHALGVKISIDDFGKEYSSLSYLKKIPFDTLKIDREFIIDLETDHRDQHIIDVIINIGHTLGKKIVAEGIETMNQRDILKSYGCDIGQGYLFSKPLSDIEFLEFAAEHIDKALETQMLSIVSENH